MTDLDRREFLAGAAALSVVQPALAFGTRAKAKIRLGLIGCGGRGAWIAGLFQKHGGYELAACADYFADRATAVGDRFEIPVARRFTGLACYRRLLDAGVDAVAIETPPYFHPEQAAAAVAAGVHVYLAKPIAVDVPGCASIAASGEQANARKLCFLVDFQTRVDPFFAEAVRRVHEGALGTFTFGEASYHAGDPFGAKYKYLRDDPDNPENRLRAWGLDRALSGDIITEQNIHALDVMSWIMGEPPRSALATGGRKVRDLGDCWDHFAGLFQYPDDVGWTFSSRQFEGNKTPGGIKNRMFGSHGVLETQYGGDVRIRGSKAYDGGNTQSIYSDGAIANVAIFHRSITAGDHSNPTVAPSVQSNLITILARTSAYERRVVTWDELLRREERLDARLDGLSD